MHWLAAIALHVRIGYSTQNEFEQKTVLVLPKSDVLLNHEMDGIKLPVGSQPLSVLITVSNRRIVTGAQIPEAIAESC